MPCKVYNLIWINPGKDQDNAAPVARDQRVKLTDRTKIPALILYPSFLTPEILVGADAKLELLLLTDVQHKPEALVFRIREQLKIGEGFDPEKFYAKRPLFVDLFKKNTSLAGKESQITVRQLENFSQSTLLKTESGCFAGYLDTRAFNAFSKYKYNFAYSVSMSSKCLEMAIGFDQFANSEANDGSIMPSEPQDKIISEFLGKWNRGIEEGGKYCFKTDSLDVDFKKPDKKQPIQSWHPVFVYDKLNGEDYANLAHVADIHLSARQQILNRSRAQVIDGAPEEISPPIGQQVNVCSKRLAEILTGIGDSEADILLVGGDLIDFIQNVYLSEQIDRDLGGGEPFRIWQALEIDKKSYATRYKDFVDLISFYTLILDFCRNHARPAFLVSGNHDCYYKPFGISPRVSGVRANEGIPADHNLTFYEAILAFGETYDFNAGMSFAPEKYEWLYTVFTPFADYCVILPKQYLLGFAWGDGEGLFETPGTGHGGFGHLPRAKEAISVKQKGLLDAVIQENSTAEQTRKVIISSHFTFVSYLETIPMSDDKLGDVYVSWAKDYEEHNFGCFEKNRSQIFDHLCNRNIQIVLTGHSHRRGLYLIDHLDESGRKSVKTRYLDFCQLDPKKESEMLDPAIIVSDSGGTIPRYNRAGEFSGWGSDQPSGTVIGYDQETGKIKSVKAVRATGGKPRLAVALDYLDKLKSSVISCFESENLSLEALHKGPLAQLTFRIELNQEVARFSIAIECVEMYCVEPDGINTKRIKLVEQQPAGSGMFAIEEPEDVSAFLGLIALSALRNTFVAIKFKNTGQAVEDLNPDFERYDFESWWCFEFQVGSSTSGGTLWHPTQKKFIIKHNKKRTEIPDFEWRKGRTPAKYRKV